MLASLPDMLALKESPNAEVVQSKEENKKVEEKITEENKYGPILLS